MGYRLKFMKEFQERAQEFIKAFSELQESLNVKVVPIITTLGPDLQISDTEQKAVEASKLDGIIEGEIVPKKTKKTK